MYLKSYRPTFRNDFGIPDLKFSVIIYYFCEFANPRMYPPAFMNDGTRHRDSRQLPDDSEQGK